MKVDELIKNAYIYATGKPADFDKGSSKYIKLFTYLKTVTRDWQSEPLLLNFERWHSLEKLVSLGGLDSNKTEYKYSEPSFGLPPEKSIVYIDNGNEQIELKRIDEFTDFLKENNNSAVFHYDNFTQIFTLKAGFINNHLNSELRAKMYIQLPELLLENTENQDVLIDDPNWAMYMCAAEYARNDIVNTGQFGNLIGYASNLMEAMKKRNRGDDVMNHDIMNY